MNKDLTLRRLLALAIALVYVILVYILVSMIIPESADNLYGDGWVETRNLDYLYRVGIANFLAFVTAVYAVFGLKDIKDLRQGLLGGSFIVLIFTVLMLVPIESGDYAMVRSWMMFGNFVFLIVFANEYVKYLDSKG